MSVLSRAAERAYIDDEGRSLEGVTIQVSYSIENSKLVYQVS